MNIYIKGKKINHYKMGYVKKLWCQRGVIPPIAMGCICYQSTHPSLGAQSMLDLDHLHQGKFYNYVGGGAQWV